MGSLHLDYMTAPTPTHSSGFQLPLKYFHDSRLDFSLNCMDVAINCMSHIFKSYFTSTWNWLSIKTQLKPRSCFYTAFPSRQPTLPSSKVISFSNAKLNLRLHLKKWSIKLILIEQVAFCKTVQAPCPEHDLRQTWQRHRKNSSAKTYLQDIHWKKRNFIHLSSCSPQANEQAAFCEVRLGGTFML